MSNNKNKHEDDVELFSLKTFLFLCLGYWKWFLLSIVVFVGMGLFYVYTRQPVYERSEEILVQNQESGGGMADVANSFSQLGLFANQTSVYNELIAMTSPAVMQEVVDRLDLTLNCEERDGLRKKTLYGTGLPWTFEFPDLSQSENIGFQIKIQPDGSFEVLKMWKAGVSGIVKFKDTVSGRVGANPVKTPVGSIVVGSNPGYFNESGPRNEEVTVEVFKQSKASAVEKYVAKLKGDLADQDADVISLSIKDTSIERADDILNMVLTVYNERWMADKNRVATATSDFISDRLEVIRQELGQVDDDIAQHKSAMKIPDLQEAASGYLKQDFLMSEELLRTTNYLAMTQFLKEYLQDPANQYSILPMNTGTENMVLEQQIGAYNDILLQRNNLAANSGEQNPLVKDQDKQLAGMRVAIMRSIDSQIANLTNTLKNIDKAQASNRNELGSSPMKAKALLSVERQQLVMEQLYLFLLQKREETELTQKFTADNTRIITPPYGRQKPVSPKKGLWIIVSFLIGLGVPAGALFIAESSNTKVRSKKDLENLPVPFAGEVPHVGKTIGIKKYFQSKKQKQKEIDKPKVIVTEGKRDIPNEAFRVIRSNLDFMIGRGEHVAIALTSFNPGSGKSFIAYNLGASFALKGKRVLVVDGDLRHGSISNYVNSPRKGLTNYLTGDTDNWESFVVKTPDFPTLEVLPIGNRPPNPAELLDNGRIGNLISEAKDQYDIVLIDCPPVNVVVDTQIINQYVSRTLFVIRAGLLERKALADLVGIVEEKKLKNITVVLNGTKTEFSSYYSYGNYEAIDKM